MILLSFHNDSLVKARHDVLHLHRKRNHALAKTEGICFKAKNMFKISNWIFELLYREILGHSVTHVARFL